MNRMRSAIGVGVLALVVLGAAAASVLMGGHTTHLVQASSNPGASQASPNSNRAVDQRVAQGATQSLTTGCNLLTLTSLTVGSPVSSWVQQNIQPSTAVVGIWHFDNPSQKYQSNYFATQGAPVDQPNFTTPIDAIFVCVNGTATAPAS